MLLKLLLFYFKIDIRNYFQSKWAFIAQTIGIYLNLLIYWYTSKVIGASFESSLDLYGMNYFDYLLIGDIILQSSMTAIESNINHFFMLKINGMGDYLKTTKIGTLKLFVLRSFAIFPRDMFFMLSYFILGKIFFDFSLGFDFFLIGIVLQLIALPSFIGFSLIGLGFFSVFGRGLSLIGFINTIAAIVAGGYFPIEVLPSFIQKTSFFLTPYNTLLVGFRGVLISPDIKNFARLILGLIIWNLILFPLGILVYKLMAKVEKNQSKKFIFEK